MLIEYKPNVQWGLWVGLLLQVSCGSLLAWRIWYAPDQNAAFMDITNLAIAAILLGGVYCWALGCGDYARGKGHDGSLGSLLSLLSLLGLFILWVMPDRHPFDAFGQRRLPPTTTTPAVAAPAAPVAASAAPAVLAPPPLPGADPAGSRWYYAKGGETLGPMAEPAMAEMARTGYLKRYDLVWKSGLQNWLPAESQFGEVFNRATQPIPAPAVLPPPALVAAPVAVTAVAATAVAAAPVAVTPVAEAPAPASATPVLAATDAPRAMSTAAPLAAPARAKAAQVEAVARPKMQTRPLRKTSTFSWWTVVLPIAALLVFGLAVLSLWPQYADRLWSAARQAVSQKPDSHVQVASAEPAPPPTPQPALTANASKPAAPAPAPIAMPAANPAPTPAPAATLKAAAPAAVAVTGTYQRIDPAPVNNPKTHASSHAELLLQQMNPRLLQFDVHFEWTTTPHVHTMERELKGIAKGQGDGSFVYDYVNPVGVHAATGGHCLEIHFQQGAARLSVPPDAPDACVDTSGMAGLYARTTPTQTRSPG